MTEARFRGRCFVVLRLQAKAGNDDRIILLNSITAERIKKRTKMNDNPRLQSERNIWLATTRPNGKPHLIPIWFVWVEERFYICTGGDSVKVRNLRADGRASVALEDGNRPLIAECTARLLEKPFPAAVMAAFQQKFNWDIRSDASYGALIELTPVKWLSWQTGS